MTRRSFLLSKRRLRLFKMLYKAKVRSNSLKAKSNSTEKHLRLLMTTMIKRRPKNRINKRINLIKTLRKSWRSFKRTSRYSIWKLRGR